MLNSIQDTLINFKINLEKAENWNKNGDQMLNIEGLIAEATKV